MYVLKLRLLEKEVRKVYEQIKKDSLDVVWRRNLMNPYVI